MAEREPGLNGYIFRNSSREAASFDGVHEAQKRIEKIARRERAAELAKKQRSEHRKIKALVIEVDTVTRTREDVVGEKAKAKREENKEKKKKKKKITTVRDRKMPADISEMVKILRKTQSKFLDTLVRIDGHVFDEPCQDFRILPSKYAKDDLLGTCKHLTVPPYNRFYFHNPVKQSSAELNPPIAYLDVKRDMRFMFFEDCVWRVEKLARKEARKATSTPFNDDSQRSIQSSKKRQREPQSLPGCTQTEDTRVKKKQKKHSDREKRKKKVTFESSEQPREKKAALPHAPTASNDDSDDAFCTMKEKDGTTVTWVKNDPRRIMIVKGSEIIKNTL